MAEGKLLRQLIRSGAEGDLDVFRGVAKEVIAAERQKHHHLLANDLENILYGRMRPLPSPALQNLIASVPKDRERGFPLLSVRDPLSGLEDVVLSPNNLSSVRDILREHNREDLLRAHGLLPSDRMLFCGPPGCGKTLTAEVIASELGRPFAVVRTDSVVSSFLGETAANLRRVFDFAAAYPMVALFDEFDALGKEREDASEHGELRRVVNAVLQMLDAYEGRSLIIAATNHEGMLDTAIWRRFEEILFLKPPTPAQLCRLLAVKLRRQVRRRDFDFEDVVDQGWFSGATGTRGRRRVLLSPVARADQPSPFTRCLRSTRSPAVDYGQSAGREPGRRPPLATDTRCGRAVGFERVRRGTTIRGGFRHSFAAPRVANAADRVLRAPASVDLSRALLVPRGVQRPWR